MLLKKDTNKREPLKLKLMLTQKLRKKQIDNSMKKQQGS